MYLLPPPQHKRGEADVGRICNIRRLSGEKGIRLQSSETWRGFIQKLYTEQGIKLS